jgi:hypothetical protein
VISSCSSKASSEGDVIEGLIQQLAISSDAARMEPVPTPSIHTPRTDKRVRAYESADKIKQYGKKAFPFLLRHLNDGRQSVAFRSVLPSTVGDACYSLLSQMIFAIPEDCIRGREREGPEGKVVERPYFSGYCPFDTTSLEKWLKDRDQMSLEEIQLEALKWLISEEEKLGFPSDEYRKDIILPLQRRVDALTVRVGR